MKRLITSTLVDQFAYKSAKETVTYDKCESSHI